MAASERECVRGGARTVAATDDDGSQRRQAGNRSPGAEARLGWVVMQSDSGRQMSSPRMVSPLWLFGHEVHEGADDAVELVMQARVFFDVAGHERNLQTGERLAR